MNAYLASKHGPDYVDRARTPAPLGATGAVSSQWASILGIETPTLAVTAESVGGLPALNRGMSMIANAVATMLVNATVSRNGQDIATPLVVRARIRSSARASSTSRRSPRCRCTATPCSRSSVKATTRNSCRRRTS